MIQDLNSKYGTYVNNVSITSQELEYGDIIFIMGLKIIVMKDTIVINNVPNFLNDQKNIPLHSNNNNSNTLSSTTIDEDSIKEEIERLKKEKIALLYEMYVLKRTYCLNENKKEEEKEKEIDNKIENEKEKEKGIENDYNNIFCPNKHLELNFDIEPNLFINSENNSVYNEKEKEEYNEEILYLKN